MIIREPIPGRENTWTGPGFMRVFEGDTLTFRVDDIPKSLEYDIFIRYEPQVSLIFRLISDIVVCSSVMRGKLPDAKFLKFVM